MSTREAAIEAIPDVWFRDEGSFAGRARRPLSWWSPAATADLDTALRLAAIALLLRPMGPWYVRPAVLGAATLALISPRALRMPALWIGIAAAIGTRIAADWPLADNHIYLVAYWALAVGLSLHDTDPRQAAAFNSRLLLGLAFMFAVLWKASLSPDFLDGRFFRVTFFTDPRFGEAALLVGGLSADQLAANRDALTPFPEGAALLNPAGVVEPPRMRAMAALSTWGIVSLEAAVAIVMLLRTTKTMAWMRHAVLLTFCLVTYAFAPVAGFGWLLLVMGAAQAGPQQPALRRLYVCAFGIVLFYTEVPWAALLLELGS